MYIALFRIGMIFYYWLCAGLCCPLSDSCYEQLQQPWCDEQLTACLTACLATAVHAVSGHSGTLININHHSQRFNAAWGRHCGAAYREADVCNCASTMTQRAAGAQIDARAPNYSTGTSTTSVITVYNREVNNREEVTWTTAAN